MSKKWFLATLISSIIAIVSSFLLVTFNSNSTTSAFNIANKLSPTPLLKAGGVSQVKEFTFSGEFKDSKTTAKVYQVKKINAKDKAFKLASTFGVSITSQKQLDAKYSITGKDGTVTVAENGGGFIFYKSVATSEVGFVPSETESAKIAQDYLVQVGLFYPEMKATGIDQEVVEYSDGRKEIINRNVYFQYKLDNLPISSGVTRVQIGKNGVIEVVSENKKELEEIGVYPIISSSEAIKAANDGNGVYAGDKAVADTGYITNVDIVYMDNGPFSSTYQQYHPVYILSGKLDSLDSKDSFSVQVRALTPTVFSNDEPNTNRTQPITEKEYSFKSPDSLSLTNPNSSEAPQTIPATADMLTSLNKILQESNGVIEGYGDVEEVKLKTNDILGSLSKLEVSYTEPTKMSLQFGKSEKTVFKDKDKDKYGNVMMDVKKVIIPVDKNQKSNTIIVLGVDKGLLVKLDSMNDIQSLINNLP